MVYLVLENICKMLQCDTGTLKRALTERTVEAKGERLSTPLSIAQVRQQTLHLTKAENIWFVLPLLICIAH